MFAGAAAVLALVLVAGACGGDDASAEDATTTTTTTAPADDTTTTTGAGEAEEGPAEAEPITPLGPEELCELLPGDAVATAVGSAPEEVRSAGNLCEYSFGGYVLRLQEYTGVFEPLEGLRGAGLVGGLRDFLDGAGESPEPIEGVGDGAFQVDQGWVYVVTGGNLLLIDNGFGTLPDDFDGPAVFHAMAVALGANL